MFVECLSLCPWGGEDPAVWSLGISAGQQRRGRPVCLSQPQCDWSYGKLQRAAHCWFSRRPSGRAVPVFCLLLSSEHVELLLLQRRGKLAAHHHRAKPLSDAEGGAFRWRHEVPPSSFPFLSVLLCALVCQGGWGCPLLKCWNHEWIIPKIFRQSSYENQSSSSEWNIPGEMCAWGCVYFRADECPAHTFSYCSPIHGDAFESKSRAVCMRIVSSKYRKV